MTEIMSMLPVFVTIIGILAFVVSVIIEVIKNIGPLAKVPTNLVVMVVSIVLSVVTFFGYACMQSMATPWYYVIGSILAGFFVAFIAMYGWDKLTELYKRFKQ